MMTAFNLFLVVVISIISVAAFAAGKTHLAGETDEWLEMPDGYLYHPSCVHRHTDTFHVDRLVGGTTKVVDAKGSETLFPPCPYNRRKRQTSSIKSISTTGDKPNYKQKLQNLKYYSDWSVYAQTTAPSYTFMTSAWKVPTLPVSRGPAGLSSVYFFNGLEDGGGHHGDATLILQPVLQFGKSGCLVNPLQWGSWHLTAYLVDGNGRAHCGPHISVTPGQTVVGAMENTGNNTWVVTATAVPKPHESNDSKSSQANQTSTYTGSLGNKVLNAAYLTLEGMVIYNCQTYPGGGGTQFTNIAVHGPSDQHRERQQNIEWIPEIRHNDCHQGVNVDSVTGDMVTLVYNST